MLQVDEHAEVTVYRIADGEDGRSVSGELVYAPRLIPISSANGYGATGTATFRLLRRRLSLGPIPPAVQEIDPELTTGDSVCIKAGDTVLWAGYVTDISADDMVADQSNPSVDEIGTVTAVEFGQLFNSTYPTSWPRDAGTKVTDMDIPPTANINQGGQLIGNAIASPLKTGAVWIFASRSSDHGTEATKVWTRYRLLNTLFASAVPAGFPTVWMDEGDPLMSSTTAIESWPLEGKSVGQIVDMLVGPRNGLTWRLEYNREFRRLELRVETLTPVEITGGSHTVPANTPQNIEVGTECRVLSFSKAAPIDQVVIEGAPIRFAATVGWTEGTGGGLDRAWTAAQQTDYEQAASAAADYAGLSPKEKKERNAAYRGKGELADVFSTFKLKQHPDWNSFIHGLYPEELDKEWNWLCPLVTWDGTTATVNDGTSPETDAGPAASGVNVLQSLPIEVGTAVDGSTSSDSDRAGAAELMPPMAFRYDPDATVTWLDLSNRDESVDAAQISIPADGPHVGISYTPREFISKNQWGGGGASRYYLEGEPESTSDLVDWQQIRFTIGVESSQRLRVTKTRDGVTVPRRRIVIRQESLQFWRAHQGTVIGVDADGDPDYYATARTTRNDYPAAERLAIEVAAYAFRSRYQADLILSNAARTDSWLHVGSMIGTIKDISVTRGSSTGFDSAISTIVRDYTLGTVRFTTQVEDAAMLFESSGAGSGVAPSGGMARRAAPTIVRQGYSSSGSGADEPIYRILGGQLLAPLGEKGIKRTGTAVTAVATRPDLSTNPTLPDGLGWAQNIFTGQIVYVAHWLSTPNYAALVGQMAYIDTATGVASVDITDEAGESLTAYGIDAIR